MKTLLLSTTITMILGAGALGAEERTYRTDVLVSPTPEDVFPIDWDADMRGVVETTEEETATAITAYEPPPRPVFIEQARRRSGSLTAGTKLDFGESGIGLFGPENKWAPEEVTFNPYQFEELIHQDFEGKFKGYSVVIANHQGIQAKVYGGWARDPADTDNGLGLRMDTTVPGNIGSVSKVFSGVAMMRVFQEKGWEMETALDRQVLFDLPLRWQPLIPEDGNNRTVTYRHLLTHTSGVDEGAIDVPDEFSLLLSYYNFTTPFQGTQGTEDYDNENFRVLTYLVPRNRYPKDMLNADVDMKSDPLEQYLPAIRDEHGLAFEDYMRDEFFPLVDGTFAPSCDPEVDYANGQFALMYADINDTTGGIHSSKKNIGSCRGQGGYYASAAELARFMATLEYTEQILSAENQQLLENLDGTGVSDYLVFSLAGTHDGFEVETGVTTYRGKSGTHGVNGDVAHSMVVFLPYGWFVTLVANSDGLDSGQVMGSLLEAFYQSTRGTPTTLAREAMRIPVLEQTTAILQDFGMGISWLDLYSIGGEVFANAVYTPGDDMVAGKVGMTGDQYQDFFDEWVVQKGFAVKQVDSYMDDGKVRYAAIITDEAGPHQRAYHGLSEAAHQQTLSDWESDGYRPVNISVVSVGSTRYYTALYEYTNDDPSSWVMETGLTQEEFEEMSEMQADFGRKPVAINAYRHYGTPYYAAIWVDDFDANPVLEHHLDRDDYRAFDADMRETGRMPNLVTGVDSGQPWETVEARHRFGAAWN